jgi:hypothetical protein
MIVSETFPVFLAVGFTVRIHQREFNFISYYQLCISVNSTTCKNVIFIF